MQRVKQSPVPLILLALALLTGAVFARVLTHDFINYDDPDYVTDNRHVQQGVTLEAIKWAFKSSGDDSTYWHPLTWISHMVDCQIYGVSSWGHHLTNVLFHITNVLLLFTLLRKLTGAVWRSAFVAALFALHPIQVDTVAWVAERKNVLSTMFWLLTTLAYVRYARQRSIKTYIPVLLLFALGLMCKPMLVTLPCTLLLLDLWPLRRVTVGEQEVGKRLSFKVNLSSLRLVILEKVPLFALSAISSGLTIWAHKKLGMVTSVNQLSLLTRIESSIVSYVRYLKKVVWPDDLAILYPYVESWPNTIVIGATLLVIAICVLVVLNLQKRPYLAVGWFWFMGTLVPTIGIIQVGIQAMADRFAYVPLIGLFIAITWGVSEWLERLGSKRFVAGIGTVVIVACVIATSLQLKLWQNSGTLFGHAVKVTEKNYLAHNNLGYYLYNTGKGDEAMEHYRRALEIFSGFEIAWNNMGYALANKDRHMEAIVHYRQALKLNPRRADVYNNLGNSLGNIGKNEEAIEGYLKALELNPEHADTHNNLGVALAQQGKMAEGVEHIRTSLRLRPNNASAHSNLGNALAIQGKLDEAIEQYQWALRIKPDDAQAHNNLGNALSGKERLSEAVSHYQTALKLNANNPEAHCNIGLAFARLGQTNDARIHLNEALRLRPNYPEAQRYLAAMSQPAR